MPRGAILPLGRQLDALKSFSAHLAKPRSVSRRHRRARCTAATATGPSSRPRLDLALNQAGGIASTPLLGAALPEPASASSHRCGLAGAADARSRSSCASPSTPDLQFKLDPTASWDAALVAQLAALDAVGPSSI